MSITTTIHQLICLSKNYNENAQNTGNVTFTEAFEELPELSEKIRHVENVLNSLPDHNIIVALNLMYVGTEINEDETFRACYCKYTRFSSTHFLRFRYFQLITGILPVSDYSGIHVDAPGYIPSASVP